MLHDATNESVSHVLKVSTPKVFRSPDMLSSSQEWYLSTMADVIEKMVHQNIHIRSIVGDGFFFQFGRLLPTSGTSIQNHADYIEPCSAFAPIIGIYCNCH
jgi:hypothetical protein